MVGPEGQAGRLRRLVSEPGLVVIPGVYDCVSAMAARDAEFQALYVGSYATGASLFGFPDTGYVGLSDMVGQISRIAGAVDLPIVADGEGGFGNAVHVARMVREYERAGAAAVHVEDHLFGKHVFARPTVLPLQEAVDKVRSAVDARKNADFQIIARTDCLRASGLDHAVERGVAFAKAGADVVFIAGLRFEDIPVAAQSIPVPLLNTSRSSLDPPDMLIDNARLGDQGLKIVLYNDLASFLAYAAVAKGLRELQHEGRVTMPAGVGMREFDRFLGIESVRDTAKQYGVAAGEPFI